MTEEEKDKIIKFSNDLYLVWAEPDEGNYNYCFYPLRKRWGATKETKIPEEIIEQVKSKAGRSYPIMIIDGYDIDDYLDGLSRARTSSSPIEPKKVWGMYPRKTYGTLAEEWGDSVNTFSKECDREY